MHVGDVGSTVPSKHIIIYQKTAVGFNVEYVKYENINFQMWDLGGQTEIR